MVDDSIGEIMSFAGFRLHLFSLNKIVPNLLHHLIVGLDPIQNERVSQTLQPADLCIHLRIRQFPLGNFTTQVFPDVFPNDDLLEHLELTVIQRLHDGFDFVGCL